MSKRAVVAGAIIAGLMLVLTVSQTKAQDSAAPKGSADGAEPGHAYRVDFVLTEIEDGKKINSRQYALNLNAGEADQLKIGTRVPVEVKQGEIQYLDVGTSIWCRLRDRKDIPWLANDVMMNVTIEISNFAIPDQQGQSMHPAIRQMKIDSSTIAIVGKQLVVGSVDDPNSRRQYQLEVTATRLK
ncbi:MAG TPA: hypothetical protein VMG82_13110 [Candidatus Sulfotelmatobacter sp.]|nr:hypothetical protein [Candidatus Sulfotelmatobacter sp.]